MKTGLAAVLDLTPAPLAARLRNDARVARLLRPIVNRLVPAEPTAVTVRSGPGKGLRIVIDPATEKYYWTGAYEQPVQRVLAQLLGPGMTFWDVGAHAGFFTLTVARLVGQTGRVDAFEPAREPRARLTRSLALNGFTNAVVHDCALGKAQGHARLYLSDSSSQATLRSETGHADSVEVESRTLDDLALELGPPDLVKIDVEGLELDVLRGGARLLATRHPHLLVEFHDAAGVRWARGLLAGYSFQPLSGQHWLLEPASHEQAQNEAARGGAS